MVQTDNPQLRAELEDSGGLIAVPMERLRDELAGTKKLGVHVKLQITNKLDGMGIGYFPLELPDYQDQQVRLYSRGSPIAEIIEAVLHPSDEGDKCLREASTGEAQELLRQIRALVCI
jgi:hypothetical protein